MDIFRKNIEDKKTIQDRNCFEVYNGVLFLINGFQEADIYKKKVGNDFLAFYGLVVSFVHSGDDKNIKSIEIKNIPVREASDINIINSNSAKNVKVFKIKSFEKNYEKDL